MVSCYTRIFERRFVAFGLRISFRVVGEALFGVLKQDAVRLPSACRSAGARLTTANLMLPCPSATRFLPMHHAERRRTVCMRERTLSRTCAG